MRIPLRVAVFAALVLAIALGLAGPVAARELTPVALSAAEARPLVDRLRQGGLVLFVRHADTAGMPCDSSYRVGDRAGQRNISERGREQSRRFGAALREQGIPVARPVLAGPVYRARDTAEEAFGAAAVEVVDGLTADDFAGSRLGWVLAEHRRLMAEPVPAGANRILVGHRTPAIMIFGEAVAGRAFPEGAAIVIDPAPAPRILGIVMPAPIPGAGFHGC
ncbi:MAG: histidine phosphatase family protein [Phreatobacter sp.]|jgi:phosphohistidine phosphatase SixA|uniref:histidine phosphatase family protein n=1 Tax=Phreatobacter sp. TaxID=1966341 RepID=UPI0040371FEA